MVEKSNIEWTHSTFNPWQGCSKVSPGCAHCYAEQLVDIRFGRAKWGPQGTRTKTSESNWQQPLKWDRQAQKSGERHRVFCASLADVFEDWHGQVMSHNKIPLWKCDFCGLTWEGDLPAVRSNPPNVCCKPGELLPLTIDHLRQDLFALIDATPNLDWLLLTKRPENITGMWPFVGLKHSNVWIGTSVESQDQVSRVNHLVQSKDLASVLFLSCEPLLGPVYVGSRMKDIDWVIVGGESGKQARPMETEWAELLRDQCAAFDVPFFMKQMGGYPDKQGDLASIPNELRIRQFPTLSEAKPALRGNGSGRS